MTDSHSCDARAFRTITEPNVLTVSPVANITPATCNGSAGGSIEITVTGGTTPYSFLWSNNETTQNISNLTAGCYTVTVTDAHLCTATGTFCVGQPDPIVITGTPTDVLCKYDCNGSIAIDVIGGTAPYTFLWNDPAGSTTQNVGNLCEGDYTVFVLDAHECSATQTFHVGAPEQLAVEGSGTAASCYSYCDGSIDITVTGGTAPYTYVWSDPAGTTTEDVTGLCAGDYWVTITDAHLCTLVDSWTVTEPGEVSWEGQITNVSCNGVCDGTITQNWVIGGTPPYTYYWEGPNGFTSTSQDLTGLCAGLYSLTVTDSHSCDARAFRTITEPGQLVVDPNAVVNTPSCNGDHNGSIEITVTGGTTPYGYSWEGPSGYSSTNKDLYELGAGCYNLTVTDAHGCTATGSWCLTEPDVLTASGVAVDALCKGDCNGTIDLTVTGGTLPYSYLWSTVPPQTSEDLTGLCEGTYYVTVTDAHSCEVYKNFTIGAPEQLVIGEPVVTNVTCNGASNGSINGGIITGIPPVILPIPVTGGTLPYSYLWSNGFTTDNLCCLTAGCYTVTVTDAHGCTATGSWCVTEPPAMTITGTPVPVNCFGDANGSIDITVEGGTPDYTYEWSNGETTEDISNLTAGVYTVTVTDANGCPKVESWEVTSPADLVVTGIPTDVLCHGFSTGSIDITVTGGTMPYSFAWSTGETTEDISGLSVGCYTVTVTDAHSCETVGSWCITEPEALALDANVTDNTCYLGSIGAIDLTVTGGVAPYTYLWSNSAVTEDISGLTAGVYTVTVTDAHLCTITASYEVLQPPAWWVDITGPSHACCNSGVALDYYATVGGDEGYLGNCPPCETFQWTVVGGVITSGWNTNHITVLWDCCGQGTITVVATKCDGCYVTDTKTVTVHLPPSPIVTGPAGVMANSTATYTTPYVAGHLYSWSVVGGAITTGQGTNTITVVWGPYPSCGCGSVTVCESETFQGCNNCTNTGCTGCNTLNITLEPDPNSIQLQGYVYYKNDFNTAMNGVTVKLRNTATNTIVATTTTGPNMNSVGEPGYYSFDGITAGSNYKLEASYNGTWGGNNATDALLVQLQAGGLLSPPLTGINWTAGDVNASNTITSLDALYIKLRTVGSISSYPAGNWVFESPAVVIPTVPLTDIYGLCVGDVNGSYIPTGFKDVSFLSVTDNETQTIPVAETFEYQIRSNMVSQLGAMTLFMGYDNDRFEVTNVTAPSNDEMKYVIENGNVAIAWADTRPLSVKNDDALFTLTMKAKAPLTEATQVFNVKAGSEFASPTGTRFDNFDLKMAKVQTMGSSKEFTVFNYPNPFTTNTKITYTLPESAKVTLVITDIYGKTIRTLVDGVQSNGSYTIPVNAAELNLAAGVYLYRIDAVGETDSFVKVNKMIFAK